VHCLGSGHVFGTERAMNRTYTYRRDCVCKLEDLRRRRLSLVPPEFQHVRLDRLLASAGFHPLQGKIFEEVRLDPAGSYFFGGTFGTGKTMLLWALYCEAVMRDMPRIVACTLTELLGEYKAAIQASIEERPRIIPRLVAENLRQKHTRYSIFLDDVDKARPTEYAAEQLFEIADAIYNYQHQVVVTTNLSLEALVAHFKRADDRFGGTIVRRLVHNAKVYEMF
jgi:DNA replication protein DnaC